MPRKACLDLCGAASAKTYAPGALHHIIVRGIERKAIFKDNHDRDDFFERLDRIFAETKTGCYAWVFMTNHIHLLLKTGLSSIATVMRSRRWRDLPDTP